MGFFVARHKLMRQSLAGLMLLRPYLESYPEHTANAPFVYARRVGVGEAAHIFDVEEL